MRSSNSRGPAHLLAELPGSYRWLDTGHGHLVIGPTGAFVIGEGGRNPALVAHELAHWAGRLRAAVGAVLSWAPFVDVLVVADRTKVKVESASVVTPDMLIDTLVSGPELLDPEAVDQLAALAERVASATGDGRTAN
jgi:hypothetical protein